MRRLTRDNQGSPTCARDESRRNTRHARPELYASTREEKLWHWSTCDGRISTLHHEGEYSLNCRKAGDEHMCGLLQYCLYSTRDAAQNWGGRNCIDTQRPQVDERDRVPMRVARLHQGRTHCGNCARRRHNDWWRTIGGGTPHQYDIKKIRDQENR